MPIRPRVLVAAVTTLSLRPRLERCRASLVALLQPGNDACRDLVRRLAAHVHADVPGVDAAAGVIGAAEVALHGRRGVRRHDVILDRKSTRLNSSHSQISYAVFCLQK